MENSFPSLPQDASYDVVAPSSVGSRSEEMANFQIEIKNHEQDCDRFHRLLVPKRLLKDTSTRLFLSDRQALQEKG